MSFIKAEGVPLVITIFLILMGVGGTVIGIQAIADPTAAIDFVPGADDIGTAWGGRNLGLGLAALAAVAMRNVNGYVVALVGGICRELSDVIVSVSDGGSLNVPFAVIMVVEIGFLALCVMNAIKLRTEAEIRH